MVQRHSDTVPTSDTGRRDPRFIDFAFPLEAWKAAGLCSQTDPEAFFPEKGGSTREAKAICRRCEVAAECLDYALDNEERFGIWGGMSERERRKITARRM